MEGRFIITDPGLDSRQTEPDNVIVGQINDLGYEVSRKDLETLTKSEIKPSWVDSNEEIINQYQNRKPKNWSKQN